MMRQRLFTSIQLSLIAILTTGCATNYTFRSETTIHPDGSISRAIYQPVEATPPEILQPVHWERVSRVLDPEKLREMGWEGPIRETPKSSITDAKYFAAWGKFVPNQKLPAHVIVKGRSLVDDVSTLPAAELKQEGNTADYVFVVEREWTERLNDAVKLSDIPKAADELADLLITAFEQTADRVFGPEYDSKGFVNWLRTEGRSWFLEAVNLYVEFRASDPRRSIEEFQKPFASLASRHGLELTDSEGELFESDLLDATIQEFIFKKLTEHLKRRNGKPIEKGFLRRRAEELYGRHSGRLSESVGWDHAFAEACRKLVKERVWC